VGNFIDCNVAKVILSTGKLNDEQAGVICALLSFDGVNYIETHTNSNLSRKFDVIVNTQKVKENAYEDLECQIKLVLLVFTPSENFDYEIYYK
jgi:hypothetical protein